jgi:hypothetical protein
LTIDFTYEKISHRKGAKKIMTTTTQPCVLRTITTIAPNYTNEFRTTNLMLDNVFQSVADMKKWYNSTDLPKENKEKHNGVTVLFGYIANDLIYWTANISDTPSKVITEKRDFTTIELHYPEYR